MDRIRVFTAKRVHTMDEGRPLATAVAVSGGRIVSVLEGGYGVWTKISVFSSRRFFQSILLIPHVTY